MDRVLVTGGHGLVGKALQKLAPSYFYPRREEMDLLKEEEIERFFEKYKPQYVIHLAANVGGLFKNMKQKVEMLEQNLIMNMNIIKVAHKYKVKKLVALLSTCIFPDKISYPIDETMLHQGAPHPSNEGYAYAKRILELQCRLYREQFGDNFITLIPTNIYGPHDNFSLEDAHVIPALIHKCFLAKQSGEPFIIGGSGKPLRQFLYSEDLARIIIWSLSHYNENEPLIVAPEQEYSISEVASFIVKAFDYEKSLKFDTSFSDGQYKKTASSSKLRSLYPSFEFTDFRTSLIETIKWFQQHYPHIRGAK